MPGGKKHLFLNFLKHSIYEDPPKPPLGTGGPGTPYNGGKDPPNPPLYTRGPVGPIRGTPPPKKTLFRCEWPFSIPQSPRFTRGLIMTIAEFSMKCELNILGYFVLLGLFDHRVTIKFHINSLKMRSTLSYS